MALVSTFPSDPSDRSYFRKIDTGLNVTYSRRIIDGSWAWTNGLNEGGVYNRMVEYHRYASKRYRYVGMTDSAKDACLAYLTSLYTRATWTNYWNSNGTWSLDTASGDVPLATITPSANDDGSWDVEVDVNEDDVRYSHVSAMVSAKSMFAASLERSRSYDGESET